MVEPARPLRLAMILSSSVLVAGCSLVPREKLDECHKLSRSIQDENAQLKDVTLKLRAHNQDLAQRAVDDAQRIKSLDESNQRLESSVVAYQRERDQLSSAFEQFKRQLTASVDRPPTAMLDRFEQFSHQHAGCGFDPKTQVSTFPAELLFQADSAEWSQGAQALLKEYASLLAARDPRGGSVLVVGVGSESADPQVRRAGLAAESPAPDRLAQARAIKIRDLLVSQAHLEPGRVTVAAESSAQANDAQGRRIEIHLGGADRPQAAASPGALTPPAPPGEPERVALPPAEPALPFPSAPTATPLPTEEAPAPSNESNPAPAASPLDLFPEPPALPAETPPAEAPGEPVSPETKP
ncbi:MAG TPA: hypothetical protein VGZ22_30370 [Isosphaeraceae bacterium]|nr:hypothetical protein [Isosphaeraceae bacterium]